MSENRIDAKFAELKKAGKKALITYVTAGDGGYENTEKAVLAMEQNGADIIEIGVPFSDPIAEGIVIQEASLRALKAGTTLKGVFEMVRRLREKTDMPLLLMLYANTVYSKGAEHFFATCREVGIDGVIIPDMPFEEHGEFDAAADANGVYNISMVTPTSHERIAKIASQAKGFLYCVSSVGVTGVRSSFKTEFSEFFNEISASAACPYCVGFGIGNGETAAKMGAYCDGVIVGSAVVKRVGLGGEEGIAEVTALTRELRAGLDA